MTFEKNTLTADRTAAADLAKEVYDKGVTDLTEIDALDDTVAELNPGNYKIPVYSEHGELVETIQVKNIGDKAVQDAMGVHSGDWRSPDAK